MGNKMSAMAQTIRDGHATLGIELGSTRIKAALLNERCELIAAGAHDWENRLENGIWTYSMDAAWEGAQDAYRKLAACVRAACGEDIERLAAIGVSGMMHGYLPFDANGEQLVAFRTWRNTMTEDAAQELSELFGFNVAQRACVAHIYNAILRREPHVANVDFLTTLSGYIHWKLTGERNLGVGDASGMFPVDFATGGYDAAMLDKFDERAQARGIPWRIADILPRPLCAGAFAGRLTKEGALLLDPTGKLRPGTPLCPPEGDAGTGMVATNAVGERTGSISAGTSAFTMIVLERPLSSVYEEIDLVATPAGRPVALVQCNNCTTDIDAWVGLLGQALTAMGVSYEKPALYDAFYREAMVGRPDAGGILSYNFYAGEHLARLTQGRPLIARLPGDRLRLSDFARSLLYSSIATLKIGMDILTKKENARVDRLIAHGGLYKTPKVGQCMTAAAFNVPVAVMEETAGEGGAWGIAILAAYMTQREAGETLEAFVSERVFAGVALDAVEPDPEDVKGFEAYYERYAAGLPIEQAAIAQLKRRD